MIENKKQTGRLFSYCKGSQLVVCRIEGDAVLKRRLVLVMEFAPGEKLSIVKYVQSEDALELTIKNCHTALRVSEVDRKYILPVSGGYEEFRVEGVRR